MTFDLEWPWKVKVKVTYILSGRRGVCYTYICQYCITMVIYMSQKGLRQAGGVFRCLSGLSCFFQIWVVVCPRPYAYTFLKNNVNTFFNFSRFFSRSRQLEPYGGKHSKTLLLSRVAFDFFFFQTSPGFSSQLSSLKVLFWFSKFWLHDISRIFFR